MFRLTRSRFGYRKKRDYLDDGYRNKAGIVVWLQRLIMLVLIIVLLMFLLLLGNVVDVEENAQRYSATQSDNKEYEHEYVLFNYQGPVQKRSLTQ